MIDYEIHTLPNGIRLVHKQVSTTKIVHCGFILDIGSRDEEEENQGIAHFWEHMAFKGTTKRKVFHVLNRLESVGGELNAFTTKEKIAFYAAVLDTHFEKAFELLVDITFDSVFPEKEIEKERNVILEEMSMYRDTPDDAIQDEFDRVIFGKHSLGMNILGTEDSVGSFTREDFKSFIANTINTGKIVFSSVGNIPFKEVKRQAEKYLTNIPIFTANRPRRPFEDYRPREETFGKNVHQSHCALGRTAYRLESDNRLPFFMLVNVLGGPGMNSRLNLALREKYGFVYAIDAHYQPYSDTGLFGVFFATDPKQLERSIKLIQKEFKKLREVALGTNQLHMAKEQLIGQLAMAEENNSNLMLMMGKSLLDRQRIDSLELIIGMIRSITSGQLMEVANEMLVENELSKLIYSPK